MELKVKDYNQFENIKIHVLNCKNGYWDNFEMVYEYYKPYIFFLASKYYYINGDREDLIQQGLIGLYNAIKIYDKYENKQFNPLAKLCIKRSILQLIRSSTAKKELIHSDSILLFNKIEDELVLIDIIINPESKVPENVIINKEQKEDFQQFVTTNFSILEREVLNLHIKGYSLKEISNMLDVSYKTVDNAKSRFKRKFRRK